MITDMKWQDIVIAICQLCFLPAMLPTILGKDKPPLVTSALNTIIVLIVVGCFLTLHLWFAAATGFTTGMVWFVLAVQKYKMSR